MNWKSIPGTEQCQHGQRTQFNPESDWPAPQTDRRLSLKFTLRPAGRRQEFQIYNSRGLRQRRRDAGRLCRLFRNDGGGRRGVEFNCIPHWWVVGVRLFWVVREAQKLLGETSTSTSPYSFGESNFKSGRNEYLSDVSTTLKKRKLLLIYMFQKDMAIETFRHKNSLHIMTSK